MLYHPKMGKLLAKEGNVSKVPVHTYGERERERERERKRGGGGGGGVKGKMSAPSALGC